MAQFVGDVKTGRANRRLAYIRLNRPTALPNIKADSHYTPREFRRIKRTSIRLHHRASRQSRANAPSAQYDPLAPLTGKEFNREERAQQRAQFGPQTDELNREFRGQAQTAANTATYYDDYKAALKDATDRIQSEEAANVAAQQGQVNTSYAQDTARQAQLNAEESKQAALLGRGPVTSPAGDQAAAAQRTQGNASLGLLRDSAQADNTYMALETANSVLAKAEAMQRQQAKRDDLVRQRKQLNTDKANFKYKFRNDMRENERTYALARKEFGLKKQTEAATEKYQNAQLKQRNQTTNAQKIIAKIYASANKAQARAQVRVAKLQLQKGKIDRHQYRTIVNTYHGLPKHGQATRPGGSGGSGGKRGKGSGPNGSLLPWERDKVDLAMRSLISAKAKEGERSQMISKLVAAGVPARLARIAWSRYSKTHFQNTDYGSPPSGGSRPEGAGNPNVGS